MSIVFYVIAACTYVGANLILLRMAQAAIRAGSFWKVISPNFYEVPGQLRRFVIFGICICATFACIVIGRSFELGHWPA